jgi:hypothetical protein
MPSTIHGVRKLLRVEESPEDAGLVFNVQVIAYDSGIVTYNGQPLRVERDLGRGLVNAMEHTAAGLGEFHKQVTARRAQRCTGDPAEEVPQ